MIPYSLQFDSPWFLGLLALIPAAWWFSYGRLSGLEPMRRFAVLAIRSTVLALLILALAEAQLVRTSDRLTVLYLLDQSLSIPPPLQRAMPQLVNQSIQEHRGTHPEDRVGVIVFGRNPAVEIPPLDYDVEMAKATESLLDPEHTDLASAMEMALALFPADAAKRIVLVTDGNQNMGNARRQARVLANKGVSIDVVPVQLGARSDVAVEKITLPPDVRRGQPFDLRVVLDNSGNATAEGIRGKLRILRRTGDRQELLAEQETSLPAGKQVMSVREQIDRPDFYTYEARFVADDPADDSVPQNNRATTFTHVRGRGHVLLIEDWANKGQFDLLVDRLKTAQIEVTVQSSDQLFTSLAELQRYDAVILADVPRSSGDDAEHISHFSDDQVRMLVRNTRQMGCGLVMLGGPNSFGAGGWTNSELEKAMPVDFEIKSAKVAPVGALALLMHASEMSRGNYWQKVVARESIKALGAHDYCGLLHFQGTDRWLWGTSRGGMIRVGPARKTMLARLDRMTPGDMPQFEPAMQIAVAGFAGLPDAAVKHMIIISDGDPSQPNFGPTGAVQALKQLGVKISTVAVGTHGPAGSTPLQRIATLTGGTYYVVRNARALPRIYQREVRKVARPLIYEEDGLIPQIKSRHAMIEGLSGPLPPISGFVLTSLKESHLVEVPLLSPRPFGDRNNTILAGWTYGVGKTAVLTTDAGARWAKAWTQWDQYDKFFSTLIRWSMRPMGDLGNFTVAIQLRDGKARIVVTALDKEDEFLNFLDMSATVLTPNMNAIPVPVRQTAAGRYVGQFDARDVGSYFVLINPGGGKAPIRTGIDVGYSDEFRDRETNRALLSYMASLVPPGGQSGKIIGDLTGSTQIAPLLATNSFRHDLPKARASRDIWHLLVLIASCVFFADVLLRRVHVHFAWVGPLLSRVTARLLGREVATEQTETLQRLRHRKAEVEDQIARRRTAVRFQPEPGAEVDTRLIDAATDGTAATTEPVGQPTRKGLAPDPDEPSYTERLLRAKKKVWEDRS
jgi:uncharacterized membrane protein/Mg-chelatase subunit ChlD